MTGVLALGARLAGLDAVALADLLRRRGIPTGRLGDLFDLAEALGDPGSLERALAGLDRVELAALVGAPATADIRTLLSALALTDDDGAPAPGVLDALTKALADWKVPGLADLDALRAAPVAAVPAADAVRSAESASVERAAGAAAAVLDVLDAVEATPARELAKGGIATQDAQRLAAVSGLEPAALPSLIRLAAAAHVIGLDELRWRPGADAAALRAADRPDRWRTLVAAWLDLTGTARPLVTDLAGHGDWATSLPALAAQRRPGDVALARGIPLRLAEAETLGLTVQGVLSPLGAAVAAGDLAGATATLRSALPEPVDRVYLQDDLTVIALGPLAPTIETRLRAFAEPVGHGLASSYRISESSVRDGLDRGASVDGIRSFLTEISLSGLPQPLRYLLDDLEDRAMLRVSAVDRDDTLRTGIRTSVEADEPGLLDAVRVDARLRALQWQPGAVGRLLSRVSPDAVYWTLRDARYPVAPLDTAPSPTTVPRQDVVERDPHLAEAERLLAASAVDDRAWLARQLEAAIRAKAAVTVTVAMPDGSEQRLLLEPASVAGGRLRARDPRLTMERTLPLASIVAVDAA